MSQKVIRWDSAVRLFHWSQPVLIAGLWYTGEEGLMVQHQLMAYLLLALFIGRLMWGFWGSQSARFQQFCASPAAAWRYLRHPMAVAGHNPASFYMIMLLMLLTAVQLLTGLATFDNSYLSDGPLVNMLPASWVDVISSIHSVNINLLLAAIFVHIVAAIWHSLRVHNVIAVMITGKDHIVGAKQRIRHSGWYFLGVAILLLVLYLWQGKALLALL